MYRYIRCVQDGTCNPFQVCSVARLEGLGNRSLSDGCRPGDIFRKRYLAASTNPVMICIIPRRMKSAHADDKALCSQVVQRLVWYGTQCLEQPTRAAFWTVMMVSCALPISMQSWLIHAVKNRPGNTRRLLTGISLLH